MSSARESSRHGGMKHELKKVDPLAAGKVVGLLYAVMMLLFLPFCLLFIAVGIFQVISGRKEAFGMIGMGVFFLFSPLIYGVLGFVAGALGALVYNLIAWKCGGLVFETAAKE